MPSSAPSIMTLNLADAQLIAEGATEKAEALGIKVCVSVSDAGGRLVALNRMDGAVWSSVHSSQGKALTSSAFNISSRRIGAGHARLFGHQGDALDFVYLQGAAAVFRDNVTVGSCGVAGGTGAQDEECARAGIAKITRTEPIH